MPTSCARLTVMVLTRMGQRVGQGQGAIVRAAEIGGLVAVDVHRLVIARVPGRDAGFQRRQIDERLEGRAGLAMRLGGAVEHRVSGNPRRRSGADTAPSGFIITTAASLGAVLLAVFVDGAQWRPGARLPAPWAPAWCARSGRRLARRRSPSPACLAWSAAVSRKKLRASSAGAVDHHGGMGAGLIGLRLGDRAGLHHRIQHQAGALLGAQQIAAGREDRRRARQGRQHRGLGQSEIARRGAEIDMRRAVHAIGGRAQIDAVEIEFAGSASC